MEEVPLLAQLQKTYSRTATIIGISIDTDIKLVDRTVKARKMTWPILADERGFDAPIPTAYHVQGTPDIFVLDGEGRILKRTSTATEIEAALQPIAAAAVRPAARQSASRWYKGNLHAHSINSDGDSPPDDLVAWYKRNGYHFLAITDHNTFTDPAPFDTNPNDDFLVIGAEEITNARTVHVNAIGISRVIAPHKDGTVTDLLQASIDAVRGQAAVPIINHPNFLWAFTAAEMKPLRGVALLEIASGHPIVNHAGDGRVPSTEEMWDGLLTGGMRIFAAAVDDSHHFREEFGAARANPGRAWVVVRAQALTRDAIVAALDGGDFYASNGPELRDVRHEGSTLVVEIVPSTGRRRYRVVFIGQSGRVLATSYDNPARYTLTGPEPYVRARVEDSNGLRAWTQPLFRR
jgi:hypothetical protein